MDRKQIAGVVSVLIAALITGAVAFAQDAHGRLTVVEERTGEISEIRHDVDSIQRDIAAICEAVTLRRNCGQ